MNPGPSQNSGRPLRGRVAGKPDRRIPPNWSPVTTGWRPPTRKSSSRASAAGRFRSPPNYRVSDLAKDLGLPVVLVAANRLGALNHILLTVDAIRAKGLTCAGIILNQLEDELDTAMITNKGVIEDLTGVPLLDHLIHGQDFLDEEALKRIGAI